MEQSVVQKGAGIVEQAALAQFRAHFPGEVVAPGETGYDEARQPWNLAVEQKPALIVFPESAEQVSAAVLFAASQGLGVAVQATGHGVSRPADGALLIRTGRLDALKIDAEARTAWVGAGLQWAPVLEAAQAVGLTPLLGSSPTVGAVGYTLGGGLGWLARKYGTAADSVNAFEVVLADGRIVRASETENEDLFWGLRGSAGSLGIITGMEIRLFPVQMVYAGNLFYPIAQAEAVITRYREWIVDLPEEMTSAVVLLNLPPLPEVPEFLRGQSFTVVRGCYCGPAAEGARLLESWRSWQEPAVDMFQELPFAASAMISMDPEGPVPADGSGGWIKDLGDEVIAQLIHYTVPQGGPPPLLFTEVRHVGGAVGRATGAGAAYGHRDQELLLHVIGMTPTPEAHGQLRRHLNAFQQAFAPHASGAVYVNFLEGEEKWTRAAEMFEPDALARLQALKATYDPANRFSHALRV